MFGRDQKRRLEALPKCPMSGRVELITLDGTYQGNSFRSTN
jgi:hypothetical protein